MTFPINELKDNTSSGFIINYFTPGQVPRGDTKTLDAHRDDFYMFFLVESGEATLMVDLHEIPLQAFSLFYVLPGQIHRRFSSEESAIGWFIGVETPMIPPDYRDAFESQLLLQQPLQLSPALFRQCHHVLNLINEKVQEEGPFQLQIMHSLLQSFLGIAAASFGAMNDTIPNLSKPVQISQQFKKLLLKHMLTVKSPSAYAELLHISESYLNEVVKKTTGFSVSYWIQHQVVLEAKRLLYYTQLTVKEIAYQLGYEDPTYFSKLFKNFTDTTPLAFRAEYRK